jgi:hypothetical protein
MCEMVKYYNYDGTDKESNILTKKETHYYTNNFFVKSTIKL